MSNIGIIEEQKVKDYVKSILDFNKYKFEDSKGKGSKIENMYDFIIKSGTKKYYFEIYYPICDQKIIIDKLKTSKTATISLDYLESTLIKKYINQFKNNPPIFLIVNLNN